MYRRWVTVACFAVLVAGAVETPRAEQGSPAGQLSAEQRMKIEASQVPPVRARVAVETNIVKGAPYFADVVVESVQELPDGNRIVNKTTGRVYRDSQGRTRREEDRAPGQVATVSINDPVAETSVVLNPETKTAWRTSGRVAGGLGQGGRVVTSARPTDPADLEVRRRIEAEVAAGGRGGAVAPTPTPPSPSATTAPAMAGRVVRPRTPIWDEKVEQLAARQFNGVMAEGKRTTRTIPAGAIGNEQPIVIVSEEWYSPELQVLVMTRTSDPRSGESTYRLENINRTEPNQTWFEIPADYTVTSSGVNRVVPAIRR